MASTTYVLRGVKVQCVSYKGEVIIGWYTTTYILRGVKVQDVSYKGEVITGWYITNILGTR
jgi:hypothetical protein